MMNLSRSTFLGLSLITTTICWLAMPNAAVAQSVAVAQVSGTVTDASGAAMANAQVTMTETDKGSVHNATTDASGQYVLPNLPVGPYRLEVKANGFKDYVRTGIVLVGQQQYSDQRADAGRLDHGKGRGHRHRQPGGDQRNLGRHR